MTINLFQYFLGRPTTSVEECRIYRMGLEASKGASVLETLVAVVVDDAMHFRTPLPEEM
jgi:hypothetical protein